MLRRFLFLLLLVLLGYWFLSGSITTARTALFSIFEWMFP